MLFHTKGEITVFWYKVLLFRCRCTLVKYNRCYC